MLCKSPSAYVIRLAFSCPCLNCSVYNLRSEPKRDLRITAYVECQLGANLTPLLALTTIDCVLLLKRFFFIKLLMCGMSHPWKVILILEQQHLQTCKKISESNFLMLNLVALIPGHCSPGQWPCCPCDYTNYIYILKNSTTNES